jgi:hypothetical protein
MATQYAFGKVVTNGLVLALDAADKNSYVSGSMIWNDLSGNNISASFNNPGSSSFANNAINFTPTSTAVNATIGSFYSITDSRISSLTTELTLETWVNPSTANANQTRPVSPRTTETNSPLGFSLGSNIITYEINTTNGWVTGNTSNTNIAAGRWIHIMQTTSDSAKSFRTYVNGVLVANLTFTGTPNSGNGLLIGRGFFGGNFNYNGFVSIVRYYNRALSATEVLQNYNAQKSRFGLI